MKTLTNKKGTLQVEWAYNNHLFMTGPAELVFTGNLDI